MDLSGEMDQRIPLWYRYQNEYTELNQWMEDPSDILQRFEYNLKGIKPVVFEQNGVRTVEYVRVGERLVNDVGILEILSYIDTIFCRNTTLSNITEDEIYRDLQSNMKRFHKLLTPSTLKKWEMHPRHIPRLCLEVENIIFYALKRAKDGKGREFMKSVVQEIRHITEDLSKKKEGFTIPDLFRKKEGE